MIEFSIVIPLYNKEDEIMKTIESVLQQTYTNYEIIVVNDGSTDNSADIVASLNIDNLRLIYQENSGVCSARNRGIKESRNKYIAFLDADDLWLPTCLEEQAKLITDFPGAKIWGVGFEEVNNDGTTARELQTGLPDGFRGIVDNYFSSKGRVSDLYCSSSTVVHKDALTEVGLFDERIKISEDNDMWFRIIARYEAAYYDIPLVHYRIGANNRASNAKIDFRKHLAFYADKFSTYKDNPVFYRYIQNWCAISIKNYYLSQWGNKAVGREAAKKLDYSVLPTKYKYLFSIPYIAGKGLEWLSAIKKKIVP